VSCRADVLDTSPPGPFRPRADHLPVVVAKRKHGDRVDRWRWDGDLVGSAGPGWRVVRHVKGRDARVGADDVEDEPDSEITLRWLGARSPATILVKLDVDRRIIEVKVDAALPAPCRRGRFLFVDLDVDVVRDAAGVVGVRDWDIFESRVEVLGYTDASRAVARAGEVFGLALLAAWEPTLEADVAAIVAATDAPAEATAS